MTIFHPLSKVKYNSRFVITKLHRETSSCSSTTPLTATNKLLETIHERLPVILHPAECGRWLDRHLTDPTGLATLFQPYPADLLEMWQVSPLVNTPKCDSYELIAPV